MDAAAEFNILYLAKGSQYTRISSWNGPDAKNAEQDGQNNNRDRNDKNNTSFFHTDTSLTLLRLHQRKRALPSTPQWTSL